MAKMRALVAAAGRGTRAGLPYPKTLHPVQGSPILVRILELLAPYDPMPTVIVSADGRPLVQGCLAEHGKRAHLVVQESPKGMGDAVLKFAESPAFTEADHVLLLWGDIPFIQPATIESVVRMHFAAQNDLTFATRRVDRAYTFVKRDCDGDVVDLLETRELGILEPGPGERDIGLFLFRRDLVLDALREDVPGKYGRATGEHGFLYIVGHLAKRGFKVAALPCATELDLVSLNALEDLKDHA